MHKLLHFVFAFVLVALGAKVLFGAALGIALLGGAFFGIIAAIAL
jgi:hypothetical protein